MDNEFYNFLLENSSFNISIVVFSTQCVGKLTMNQATQEASCLKSSAGSYLRDTVRYGSQSSTSAGHWEDLMSFSKNPMTFESIVAGAYSKERGCEGFNITRLAFSLSSPSSILTLKRFVVSCLAVLSIFLQMFPRYLI